jgi:hypothetical protein
LPHISKAFSAGRVSYSKVRAMTRVATLANEDALLNTAYHGSAQQLERQVQLYRRIKRTEVLAEEQVRHAHRELSWHIDDAGCWVFRGRLTAEQGAVVARALEAAMDCAFEEQRSEPKEVEREIEREAFKIGFAEPVAQRRADALERVARGYLAGPETTDSAGDRYVVNLHTDIETLKVDGEGAEANIDDRSHVPAETSRRLACDASLLHWLETAEGEPLSVGRKTRSIPPAIRRALQRRDGGCRFPGCTATRFVDAHHIVHWADGGETKMENLILMCRRHHRLVHEGGFGLEAGSDRAFRFSRPDGTYLPHAPDGRSRGNFDAIRDANAAEGLEITSHTAYGALDGDPVDWQLAMLELIQRE